MAAVHPGTCKPEQGTKGRLTSSRRYGRQNFAHLADATNATPHALSWDLVDSNFEELQAAKTGARGWLLPVVESPPGAVAQTYTFDSFGKQTASSGSLVNPFQYTGRGLDPETGLYY